MFAKVKSEGILGIDSFDVQVEADISSGLPRFDIVGLPDASVKESRERVRASIKNTRSYTEGERSNQRKHRRLRIHRRVIAGWRNTQCKRCIVNGAEG